MIIVYLSLTLLPIISLILSLRSYVLVNLYGLFLSLCFFLLLNCNLFFEYSFFSLDFTSIILNLFYFDIVSYIFVFLTIFLIYICCIYNVLYRLVALKELIFFLLILNFFLMNVFLTQNILLFFIYFESALIPMVFIVGVWGSRQRKVHAFYYFYFYTLFGSIFMLYGLFYIYSLVFSFDLFVISLYDFSFYQEILIFLLFFIAFAVKIPTWPVHIWLPEAHVESPTTGSVILAGVLLKLGSYGMYRYLLLICTNASQFFTPLIYSLSIISVIYCSLVILRQIDLKKIIAYSSVIHMNFITIGVFSNNILSINSAIFLMINHGIVSSALFLCIGYLYDRYGTRILFYYSGLFDYMPLFSFVFFIFILANISLPLTSSFVGELIILLGIFEVNFFVCLLLCTCIVTSVIYSIWLYNRLIFGINFTKSLKNWVDLSNLEFLIFLPFILFIFFFGISSQSFFNILELNLIL